MTQQIENFLLELGLGLMFVITQQRVTINNTHYYVDMVFYSKILRAYLLIELKTIKLTLEASGLCTPPDECDHSAVRGAGVPQRLSMAAGRIEHNHHALF